MLIACGAQFANGKNVLCEHLENKLNAVSGETWQQASFASNVKRIFCETFGVDNDFIEEWKRKDEPPPGFHLPVRKCLTFIGDGFRDMQPNIWIDMLLRNNNKNLILFDLRYRNESEYIRNKGGITILLWRQGYENNYQNRSEQELMPFVRMLKDVPSGPISDKEIPFDIWIRNNGTLNDLHNKIDNIVVPIVLRKLCQ